LETRPSLGRLVNCSSTTIMTMCSVLHAIVIDQDVMFLEIIPIHPHPDGLYVYPQNNQPKSFRYNRAIVGKPQQSLYIIRGLRGNRCHLLLNKECTYSLLPLNPRYTVITSCLGTEQNTTGRCSNLRCS